MNASKIISECRTKTEAKDRAKSLGITQARAAELWEQIRTKRFDRAADRKRQYVGIHRTIDANTRVRNVDWYAMREFRYAFDSCNYRQSTHGANVEIKLVGNDGAYGGWSANVNVHTRKTWPNEFDLPSSYKGSISVSTHVLIVSRRWVREVATKGIAVVDGMLTIDAQYVCDHNGMPLYRARWLVQSRGFDLRVESGFILASRASQWDGKSKWVGQHYSRDPRSSRPSTRAATPLIPFDQWFTLEQALEINPMITRAMSHGSGNCESGTRDWLAKAGLETKRQIKARDLYALAQSRGDRLTLVERVIRYAATVSAAQSKSTAA